MHRDGGDYGKHFFANEDKSLDSDNRMWVSTSTVFDPIFKRVDKAFRASEAACGKACFEEYGIQGIDLSYVDKDCFNIFCLRCKEALALYPDEEEFELQRIGKSSLNKQEHVIWEWTEIIKRLEMDKRYDAAWIEEYRLKQDSAEAVKD